MEDVGNGGNGGDATLFSDDLSDDLPQKAPKEAYHPFAFTTTKVFRDTCLKLYPALDHHPLPELDHHPKKHVYWEMLQYFLFSSYEDPNGRLIVPAKIIAALVGVKPQKRGFCAIDYLHTFSDNLFPFQEIGAYCSVRNEARTVARSFPEPLQEALYAEQEEREEAEDLDSLFQSASERVWLVSGKPVSPSKQRRIIQARTKELKQIAADSLDNHVDHPARPLVEYLNEQPQIILRKCLNRNWKHVWQAYRKFPDGDLEHNLGALLRKRACKRALNQIVEFWPLYYRATSNSTRIYAMGTSVNQLPRDLRKIALAGCVEFDMRSCQLAVVAKLWGLEMLTEFLSSKQSIWEELQTSIGVGSEYKDLFKKAIYKLIFGMTLENVRLYLLDGIERKSGRGTGRRTGRGKGSKKGEWDKPGNTEGENGKSEDLTGLSNLDDLTALDGTNLDSTDLDGLRDVDMRGSSKGLGDDNLVRCFFRHRIIRELRYARESEMKCIRASGQITDAFGQVRWIPGKITTRTVRSLMAQEVQSYELKLMLSVFPVIASERNVHLVSWLHDGITVRFTAQQESLTNKMQKAFESVAAEMQIVTELEPHQL